MMQYRSIFCGSIALGVFLLAISHSNTSRGQFFTIFPRDKKTPPAKPLEQTFSY